MTQEYTLTFSDLSKSGITIPGTQSGPGKNNYNTSLDLVGPGYIGYGKSIAQNFLKILENLRKNQENKTLFYIIPRRLI
jgi:hypothetical protein